MDIANAEPLAIAPGWRREGQSLLVCDSRCRLEQATATNGTAEAVLIAERANLPSLRWTLRLSERGLEMELEGAGDLALALPVLQDDGERQATLRQQERTATVEFNGWQCRWITDGTLVDTGTVVANRNGHYRRLEARGQGHLNVRIVLEPAPKAALTVNEESNPRSAS